MRAFHKFLLTAAALFALNIHATDLPTPDAAKDSTPCQSRLQAQQSAQSAHNLDTVLQRYNVHADQIRFTPNNQIPVIIHGTGQETLAPHFDPQAVTDIHDEYDVIVVGGGPAGLTSAVYLSDKDNAGQRKKVLILEREERLGGLGMGNTLSGTSLGAGNSLNPFTAGAGAAYSAGPDCQKQYKIFQHMGLGNYKKRLSIHDPIDAFMLDGVLYEDPWEDKSLKVLPASFALAKHAIQHAEKLGMFDKNKDIGRLTDKLNWAEFVRGMPDMVSHWKDPESKHVYERFLKDPKVNHQDPMAVVLHFFDKYGRSALGDVSSELSARQFGDFYSSELEKRYTGTYGTGDITQAIIEKLKDPERRLSVITNAPAAELETHSGGASVVFMRDGKAFRAHAKRVVLASPIKLAPKLIKNFAKLAPDRMAAIDKIKMTDYLVHVLRIKGHPYRAAYDTWPHDATYDTKKDPTDFILGRWMDPKISGYLRARDFNSHPEDDYGILTVYHPIGASENNRGLSETFVLDQVEHAVQRTHELMDDLLQKHWGTQLEIELVETNRWPYSIHVVHPNFLADTEILAKPFGNIYFANNNLGAPELEEAMERGYDAATAINDELLP